MADNKKTILFFDDWLVQESRGIERIWFKAETWPGTKPVYDKNLESSYNSVKVMKNQESGQWTMWAGGSADLSKGDEGSGIYVYRSDDGLDWKPYNHNGNDKSPGGYHVFSGKHSCCGGHVFLDERASDADRRYVMAYSDLSSDPLAREACKTAYSPDGLKWTIDNEAIWRDLHTDTLHSISFNPYTQKYQITSRPILCDRRVALYQTKDWKNFEGPLVVIHPDPYDRPMVELYGMPHFFYEGYFIGFLWKMYGHFEDNSIATRFAGKVETELTYSINGINWNRTNRKSLLQDSSYGLYDFRSEYPSSMVEDGDWLRIYSTSYAGEHADCHKNKEKINLTYLTVSRLRKDGFCALTPTTDTGYLSLRPFISDGGDIEINAETAYFGNITAELRMVPDNKPVPGYEFENSIPVSGNSTCFKLRWKERENTDRIKGLPYRLHLKLDQARLYAVRLNGIHLFGYIPELDLNGSYVPVDSLPGLKPGQERLFAGIDNREDK